MSRINEALRRVAGENAGALPPGDKQDQQQLFAPAWSIAPVEAETTAVDETPIEHRESRLVSAPLSGGIEGFSSAWRECLASGPQADPGLVEQFRRLAVTLHQAQRANGLRSVMVTSAVPGDGKTLTAVNLALVLADSYRGRVLLIDADLRRPSIPSVIDLQGGAGLSDALRASKEQKLALVRITPGLTLLPAGQPIANSIEALTSPRMYQILAEAEKRFDWVILDAPPVGPTADARLLAEMVGGTLFVVRAGQTQHPDIEKSIQALGRDHIMGVVLNGVSYASGMPYYGTVPKD